MNVSLTPELEKFVNEKLKSGFYYSASEVIREGLRLLREQDDFRERKLKALDEKIVRGIRQLDSGEGVTGSKVLEGLRQRSAQRRKRRA